MTATHILMPFWGRPVIVTEALPDPASSMVFQVPIAPDDPSLLGFMDSFGMYYRRMIRVHRPATLRGSWPSSKMVQKLTKDCMNTAFRLAIEART